MAKLWTGRFSKELDANASDFNSSIRTDSRMYRQDITGSIAHAHMLGKQGIISEEDVEQITAGLAEIISDIESGKLAIDMTSEDIHSFVEGELTKRIGDAGKRLHTARSRNDQVALDIRLYLRNECSEIIALTLDVIKSVAEKSLENKDTIMPGYTHLQRGQPIVFGQLMMAYAMMLTRDVERLENAAARMNYSPLGACALAGTTYPIDRYMTAAELGFSGPTRNSIDSVSDRDFCIEIASALSILMMHLSRFSEELILWSSWEFRFIELDDSFTTGSSIMPQKKNSDMAELVRGKTGRVYGNLITLLTMLKGLPLAYNKDMQEDKEAIFDSVDTVKLVLKVFSPMIATMTVKKENMRKAAADGFINATDLADYMTVRGIPFRDAYKTVGQIVAYCISNAKTLETMELKEYKEFSIIFDDDLYQEIKLENCVEKRTSFGGTAPASVVCQFEYLQEFVKEHTK